MVYAYARVSRDEDTKYISVENQKKLLDEFADRNKMRITSFFVDNDISGYSFHRAGFSSMIDTVSTGDVILCKDASRFGRHNARVLLMLEELREAGVRVILIDDNYDSFMENSESNEFLGLKTWMNERYVLETSKKIRRVVDSQQENGTLKVRAPYGYCMCKEKPGVKVVTREAQVIRMIFELYLEGMGYRKISEYLNQQGIHTVSYSLSERMIYNGKIASHWSAETVRDILKNDYYIGTLRLRKRRRSKVNGPDHRVPRENQIVFCNHHAAIISSKDYQLVQETMQKRIRGNYRGERIYHTIFGQSVFCKECGSRMNLVCRTTRGQSRFFQCGTYNRKGKRYCSNCKHMKEQVLIDIVLQYLKECRELLRDDLSQKSYQTGNVEYLDEKINETRTMIKCKREELKQLIRNETRISESQESNREIRVLYDELQDELLIRIRELDTELNQYENQKSSNRNSSNEGNALTVLDRIIELNLLTAADIQELIERIVIDREGTIEVFLRCGSKNMYSGLS